MKGASATPQPTSARRQGLLVSRKHSQQAELAVAVHPAAIPSFFDMLYIDRAVGLGHDDRPSPPLRDECPAAPRFP